MFQSRRTFFRCAILDTLYKTDNAQCSQLLLKYRNDSLESIVHGICRVLAYAVRLYAVTLYTVTLYAVTMYTVTSLVQTRFSPCGDNILKVKIQKLSLSSPLCAAPVDLLDPPHLQVLHGLVQLAKVGCNWFFCFLCSYVRAVSVHPDVEGVLCFSDIL